MIEEVCFNFLLELEASYINLVCWLAEEVELLGIKDKKQRRALVLEGRYLPINVRTDNII